MRKVFRIILFIVLLSIYGCSSNWLNQEGIHTEDALHKSSKVVARVNGKPITEAAIKNLEIETAMYNRRLQIPREKLIEELVDRELLYQKAIAQNYHKVPAVADQIKVASRVIVSKAYMRTLVNQTHVSREEVLAEYQQRKDRTDLRQFRISHILLNNKKEAGQIIEQLAGGETFQQLAKQFSKDSTAVKGGVLGWRGANQMAPEVAIAVKQLKLGEYTVKPVKTSYGWHIVQLDEVRNQHAPSFAKQEHSITSILKRKKIKQYIDELEGKSSVVILDQDQEKTSLNSNAKGH